MWRCHAIMARARAARARAKFSERNGRSVACEGVVRLSGTRSPSVGTEPYLRCGDGSREPACLGMDAELPPLPGKSKAELLDEEAAPLPADEAPVPFLVRGTRSLGGAGCAHALLPQTVLRTADTWETVLMCVGAVCAAACGAVQPWCVRLQACGERRAAHAPSLTSFTISFTLIFGALVDTLGSGESMSKARETAWTDRRCAEHPHRLLPPMFPPASLPASS